MPCADCELCTKASVTCISSNGADNVKVMFIQDAPDEEDEDYSAAKRVGDLYLHYKNAKLLTCISPH